MTGFRRLLFAATAVVWALSLRASTVDSLQLVTDRLPPFENLDDDKAPGFSVEVLRQVFAAMGQDASFESFPWDRSWRMVYRCERDGLFTAMRTSERERICYFPDEPLKQERWVLFVRTAVGKLKFSSLDDLIGHDIAVHRPADGVFEQPTVSPELWKFLLERHNMVETLGPGVSFRMLAAGRVDYAVANLTTGIRYIEATGLSGKIEPLLSPQRNRRRLFCLLQQSAHFTLLGRDVFARVEGIQADRGVSSDIPQILSVVFVAKY
jgi:polar amino acid transport system substrate-binding protein